MLNQDEQQILEKGIMIQQQQFQYYLVLAVLLLILSWSLYFAMSHSGILITTIIFSIGIWYFPWRYYQQKKALELDLKEGRKIEIYTVVYSTYSRNINRLEPYYYLSTDDENFEVTKLIYDNLKTNDRVKIIYTPQSKTILDIKLL